MPDPPSPVGSRRLSLDAGSRLARGRTSGVAGGLDPRFLERRLRTRSTIPGWVRTLVALFVFCCLGVAVVLTVQLVRLTLRLALVVVDLATAATYVALGELFRLVRHTISPFGLSAFAVFGSVFLFYRSVNRRISQSFTWVESNNKLIPDVHRCEISGPGISEEEPLYVGEEYEFTVTLCNSSGSVLAALPEGISLGVIFQGVCQLVPAITLDQEIKKWRVRFSGRRSGRYNVEVRFVNYVKASSLPFRNPIPIDLLPGVLTSQQSRFSLPLVIVCHRPSVIVVQARDSFGNEHARFDPSLFALELEEEDGAMTKTLSIDAFAEEADVDEYGASVKRLRSNVEQQRSCLLHCTIPRSGLFRVRVRYGDGSLSYLSPLTKESVLTPRGEQEEPFLTVLEQETMDRLDNALSQRRISFTAMLTPQSKSVSVILTSRLLLIRGSFLKFFPVRYVTVKLGEIFRCHPDPAAPTRLTLTAGPSAETYALTFGSMTDRNLLYVGYRHFRAKRHLLDGNGAIGADAFRGEFVEKRRVFEAKLLAQSSEGKGSAASVSVLRVRRDQILADSYSVMKKWSDANYRGKLQVRFVEEEGIDWGGLKREYFTIMARLLFSPTSGLFSHPEQVTEGPEEAVEEKEEGVSASSHSYEAPKLKETTAKFIHPVPSTDPLVLERMVFAGKFLALMLMESARGDFPIHTPYPFTRSFCKQILGLGVHYSDLMTDMPEFYQSKILYVLENNLDVVYDQHGVELFFEEETYVPEKTVPEGQKKSKKPRETRMVRRVIPLKPNGGKIKVEEKNKKEYLQLIARYRLVTRTEPMTKAFLKGMFSFIHEDLFSLFDENELELVFCGIPQITVADFKRCTRIRGFNAPRGEVPKVVEWFWAAVENMTQDERAKLVQFITGSAHLPKIGGKNQVVIQRSLVLQPHSLPQAHTCFNQIDLPEFGSYQQLLSRLLIAVTEGSEGFGLA